MIKKSMHDIAKMAVLMGMEYQKFSDELNAHKVITHNTVEPTYPRDVDDVKAATIVNEKTKADTKARSLIIKNHRDSAKAKINTLLWLLSESEFIEDAKI